LDSQLNIKPNFRPILETFASDATAIPASMSGNYVTVLLKMALICIGTQGGCEIIYFENILLYFELISGDPA
jgi:hypothetical protein